MHAASIAQSAARRSVSGMKGEVIRDKLIACYAILESYAGEVISSGDEYVMDAVSIFILEAETEMNRRVQNTLNDAAARTADLLRERGE